MSNMENQDRYGTITAPNTIRFERTLPGPIERVWSYLTDPEKRGKWLASGPMELRVGGAARLTWLHREYAAGEELPEQFRNMEKGHSMDATVTRCEPPRLLAFTWGKRVEALSEVVIELTERGNDVLLVLTHARLPNQKDLLGISGGWHTHLDVLVELVNGRSSTGFWSKLMRLNAEYPQRIATALPPQEFMLRILNDGDVRAGMTPEASFAFKKACEVYIGELEAEGRLISAQPLVREGVIVSGVPGAFKEEVFDKGALIQVGYYRVLAADMADAVAIAKRNPEFAFSDKASVEVRPIKGTEAATGFAYPKGGGKRLA